MATKMNMKRRPRFDDADAFINEDGVPHWPVDDNEAEAFGEEFIATATSGEFIGEDARNEMADEELAFLAISPIFAPTFEEEAEAS